MLPLYRSFTSALSHMKVPLQRDNKQWKIFRGELHDNTDSFILPALEGRNMLFFFFFWVTGELLLTGTESISRKGNDCKHH